MAPLVLDGDTLGQKHKYYNKLVRDALNTNQPLEQSEEDDIKNLLNIDIANKNQNVDYILEVLKSEDQLYVSKAIKRSTWLLTDPKYAHIINPEYLHTKLYPQMTSRAFNKLMLKIRLHLKDEKRVEAFYNYIKEKNCDAAFKWLQHCSVPFIEIEIAKYTFKIPDYLVKRLFEKSFSIFETYVKHWDWLTNDSEFLLRNNADKYLDVFENLKRPLYFDFSAKATNHLMVQCSQRILEKFEFYGNHLHLATFAKHLNKRENVKDFLLKHAKNEKLSWLYTYDKIQHFIRIMPKENRFEFVKKVFIDKEFQKNRENSDMIENDCVGMTRCCRAPCNSQNTNTYKWYKFAPFHMAFTDLKKLIRAESVPDSRTSMLQVLISCAGRNVQHIQTVLQYYYEKHINEPFKFKIQFVNYFISKVDTHTLDDKTWNILCQLFHSMEVYIASENNVQSCIKAIIVRHAIRNEQVPDIIKNKFVFDTLKMYQRKLKKQEEKEAVIGYLCDYITTKAKPLNLTNESEFDEAVTLCEHVLNLIKNWGKELNDHPYAFDRVKELTKVKKEKHWGRDLSSLYDIKKSWRKAMFEESIVILPTEKVCVNALKHDPELLSRNKEQVVAMCENDTVSLRHFLSKMRIYWPQTLAENWRTSYLERLDQPGGHKALVTGLCALLSQNQISDLLKKYAPSDTKIDWNETDKLALSLRQQIAKNVHKARPQPSVEAILPYAKGDYLQYVVPSMNAILSQLSPNKSRHCIPKLLDAPVSLQKFGVHCAFNKLTSEELKPMFYEIWNSTKNLTIRTALFTLTFALLCKEKNDIQIKDIWDLLNTFIDKLTPDENKLIYKKLGEVSDVPHIIKPQFYIKSYTFLDSLPAKCNCESILNDMQVQATDIMESLDDDFVVNVMLKNFNNSFTKERYFYENVAAMSSFILASKDEETQLRRYEISLGVTLTKYLPLWDNIYEGQYCVKNNIKDILEKLADSLSYTFEKKMQIPSKIFEIIQQTLEKSLSYQKDYVVLTLWKLMVSFVKILEETKLVTVYYKIEADNKALTEEEKDKMYSETHKQIAPLFAKTCVEYLKKDLKRFGPSIYLLFADAVTKFFHDYLLRSMCKLEDQIEYALSILRYDNEKEVWLMVCTFLETDLYNIYSDSEKNKFEEIRAIAFSHPSDEIKIHYYELFANVAPYVPTKKGTE